MSRYWNARTAAAAVIAATLLTGCSIGSSGPATPTSAAAVTTVTLPVSTSSSSTTTSSSTSSTSSTPAIEGLQLSATGLGDAQFGAAADGVLAYVTAILGDSDADTDWIDPLTSGAACPGTEVRFVTWGDLVLMFSDETDFGSGVRHFAAYTYGPAYGEQIEPFGLATADGIGIGDTVADMFATHPDVVVHEAGDLAGPSFWLEQGLHGFLTDNSDAGTVISFVGGQACGE